MASARGMKVAKNAPKRGGETARKPAGKAGIRYAALLRSINIGGRTLPMPELAAIFTAAGCTAVKTYIQSGNVVFTKAGAVDDLAATVERAIEKHAGFSAPVILRSQDELRALLADAPFADPKSEKPALYVMFLATAPTKAQIAALDPNRSPGHEFRVHGKHIYLLCPDGFGTSKLTNAYFDAKLATTSTNRNFRTIRKLLEMCEG